MATGHTQIQIYKKNTEQKLFIYQMTLFCSHIIDITMQHKCIETLGLFVFTNSNATLYCGRFRGSCER